jgi:hypothetical protein
MWVVTTVYTRLHPNSWTPKKHRKQWFDVPCSPSNPSSPTNVTSPATTAQLSTAGGLRVTEDSGDSGDADAYNEKGAAASADIPSTPGKCGADLKENHNDSADDGIDDDKDDGKDDVQGIVSDIKDIKITHVQFPAALAIPTSPGGEMGEVEEGGMGGKFKVQSFTSRGHLLISTSSQFRTFSATAMLTSHLLNVNTDRKSD